MKKNIILLFLLSILINASAKEGMWPPFLLKKIKKDLMQAGLRLDMDDLYDENQASLKDAVVIFGSGCTGELISSEGLVLTNHHCGYSTVQGLSDVENNYMLQGFFAKNNQQEIPCPGLKVRIVKQYEDITDKILTFDPTTTSAESKDSIVKANTKRILDAHKGDLDIEYRISNFYQGNQYFLISYTVYRDVRLVAFPPNGIGKFGGDTDNWAWPRHTGDFGLFRVYANAENQPADYAETNVPFEPKKFLTIDVDGVQPGEFSMVYGFPGRTNEYISSYEMEVIQKVIDPSRIDCREVKLDVWNKAIKASEKTFVQYASKQARLSNYWKKWKGEVQGLENNNVLSIKQEREKNLEKTLRAQGQKAHELDSLGALMSYSEDLLVAYYYYIEALKGMELYAVAEQLWKLDKAKKEGKNFDSLAKKTQSYLTGFYKNYDASIDEDATSALFDLYKTQVPTQRQISIIRDDEAVENSIREIYAKSKLTNLDAAMELMNRYQENQDFSSIKNDPIYAYANAINRYYIGELQPEMKSYLAKKNEWNKSLMTHYFNASSGGMLIFPDANFTLRIAYGRVEGVQAEDGLEYSFSTTLDGIPPKYNPDVAEFDAPQRLLTLHKTKNYGKYAVNGTVPVCFLASNHTTGGNSGSPVLNAKGHLIGLNFDRIWQGTMSDLYFDENICRNISVNIRYILFLLDEYGEAGWLLDEMKIVGKGF